MEPDVRLCRTLFLALLVWTGASSLAVSTARACSCSRLIVEPAQKLAYTSTVYAGRVLAVHERSPLLVQHLDFAPVVYELEVLAAWKGPVSARMTVESGFGTGDCGVGLVLGERYFIATGEAGYLHMCAPPLRLTESFGVDALEREIGPRSSELPSAFPRATTQLGLLAALGLLLVGLFVIRRRPLGEGRE